MRGPCLQGSRRQRPSKRKTHKGERHESSDGCHGTSHFSDLRIIFDRISGVSRGFRGRRVWQRVGDQAAGLAMRSGVVTTSLSERQRVRLGRWKDAKERRSPFVRDITGAGVIGDASG